MRARLLTRSEPVGAGRALAWSLLNTAVGRIGTLAIGIVLARLLGPEEFGTFAVAFIALIAMLSFNELGVSLAIVRWERDPSEIAPTVTTISVGMSSVLMVAVMVGAPYFASAMGDLEATSLVRLLSLCVLINGVVATPAALLQRRFRQDQRMVADQVNVWVGAVVSVGLAVLGMGAMSLVVGRISGAALSALLFLKFSPEPYRFGFDARHARDLIGFGLPLAGASIIVFMVGFVDQVIIGYLFGPMMLGFYVLAVNLANWPVAMFSQPLRSVAPALFARMQGDPHLLRASLRQVMRPLLVVALPVCALLSVMAEEVVRLVYGDAWLAAAPVLRWLALFAAMRIFFELAYDYLVVLGRSRPILRIQVTWIVVLVPLLWVGATTSGLAGAGLVLVLVSVVVSLPLYLLEFRSVGVPPAGIGRAAILPILTAVLVAVCGALFATTLDSDLVALLCGGLTTLTVCGAVVWHVRSDMAVLREGVT